MAETAHPTLADRFWPAVSSTRLVRAVALVLGGTVALTLSAKAQVAFYPVPMTLQTLVVLVLGAAYGSRLASATVALYLLEGLAGLPVFAGAGAGPMYMAGPTGGFLVGFLLAAAFIGFCSERGHDRAFLPLLLIMTVGHVIIFACGFAWLAALIGPARAWAGGVVPFVLATIVKTLLAAAVVPATWRTLDRLHPHG